MDKKSLMIEGVEVKFPFKPYQSQMQLMSMVIKGLKQKKNCLLESPTGSGKTLALLCAALAWQEKQKADLFSIFNNPDSKYNSDKLGLQVPKIYFASRTHKQIAQVIKEFKTTEYKNVSMTVLSSRKYSCVNEINLGSDSFSDDCRKLILRLHPKSLGHTCEYKHDVKFDHNTFLDKTGLSEAWDLEDLKQFGKSQFCCPYFVSKELLLSANIIFCPYNYLIDPHIRRSMLLDLENQVIILDEGHNIEEKSRETASFKLNEGDLKATLVDLSRLIYHKFKVKVMKDMQCVCEKIKTWIKTQENDLVGFGKECKEMKNKIWNGKDFLKVLEEWGVTKSSLPILKISFKEAIKVEDEDVKEYDKTLKKINNNKEKKEEFKPFLSSTSISVLEGIFFIVDLLINHMSLGDYKVVLTENKEYITPKPDLTSNSVLIHRKKQNVLCLHYLCLNAAVSFKQMRSSHSIILTSGTLSPMSSFESELGLPFPIKFEASHVIDSKQVWVGCVGCGPTLVDLEAKHKNVHTLQFQDELGKVVKRVCDVTPKGVLCFFTSYSLMNIIIKRWKSTDLWEDISEKKQIFCEATGKNGVKFDKVILDFYSSVKNFGALLLAVCRGKISEGLDFSDDNARAVITVGIPYPNSKDPLVLLKKEYNNANKRRGLLTGKEWYEIQAYRAINQALGRCIRHCNDWGALIMVDKRFVMSSQMYCSRLSKWISKERKTYNCFDTAIASLQKFCNEMNSRNSKQSINNLNSIKQVSPKKLVTKKNIEKKYKVCCQSVRYLKKCRLKFDLIARKYPQESAKLKTCDMKSLINVITPVHARHSHISLNCEWCEVEKIVYKFYCCPSCHKTIGFQVKNVDNFSPDKLIIFNSVCSRSTKKRVHHSKTRYKQ